jgi:hypothetical protein
MLLSELYTNQLDEIVQYPIKYNKDEKLFFNNIRQELLDLKNDYMEQGYDGDAAIIKTNAVKPPMIINTVTLTVFDNAPVSLNELIKKYKKSYPEVENPDDIEDHIDYEITQLLKKSYYPDPSYKSMISTILKRYVHAFKIDKPKLGNDVIMVTLSNTDNIKKFKSEFKKVKTIKGDKMKPYWKGLSSLFLVEDHPNDSELLTHISNHHYNPETTHILNHVISLKSDEYATVEYHTALNDLKRQLVDDYMNHNDHINDLLHNLKQMPKEHKNSPDHISVKNKITSLKHQRNNLLHLDGNVKHFSLSWVDHYNGLQDNYEKEIEKYITGKNFNITILNELSKKLANNSSENFRYRKEIAKLYENMFHDEKPKAKDHNVLDHGLAYYRQMIEDYSELDGKHIILVDTGHNGYISDIIKSIYFVGIIPKSVMVVIV